MTARQIYVLGRQLVELAPPTFLVPEQTLAIGDHELPMQVTSRRIADAHALPDIDVRARCLEHWQWCVPQAAMASDI